MQKIRSIHILSHIHRSQSQSLRWRIIAEKSKNNCDKFDTICLKFQRNECATPRTASIKWKKQQSLCIFSRSEIAKRKLNKCHSYAYCLCTRLMLAWKEHALRNSKRIMNGGKFSTLFDMRKMPFVFSLELSHFYYYYYYFVTWNTFIIDIIYKYT